MTLWKLGKKSVDNSGSGMFATRDIKVGEIILEDNEFFDAYGKFAPNWIFELKNSYENMDMTNGIIKTNMIGVRNKFYVYRYFSRFNHNCNPNTENFFNGLNMVIVAIKPIKKGEELYVTYIKNVQVLDKEFMHDRLYSFFNFRCSCDDSKLNYLSTDVTEICSVVDEEKIDKVLSVLRTHHPILATILTIIVTRLCLNNNMQDLAIKYRDIHRSIVDYSKDYPESEPQIISKMILDKNVTIEMGNNVSY